MSKNDEGLIQHLVGVRYRVRGEGLLRTTALSFDQIQSNVLAPITMENTTNRLPFVLSNFANQGIQIEFKTTGIGETFTISRIIVYIKPSAAGYPV